MLNKVFCILFSENYNSISNNSILRFNLEICSLGHTEERNHSIRVIPIIKSEPLNMKRYHITCANRENTDKPALFVYPMYVS